MTARTVALVRDDTIVNLIVVDEHTPPDFLDKLDVDRHVDTAELTGAVNLGHIYKAGRGYVPPIEVTVEDNRVLITDNRPEPATELAVTTGPADNGGTAASTERTIPVTKGNAIIAVPEATPNTPVVVEVPELGIVAHVNGPPTAKAGH